MRVAIVHYWLLNMRGGEKVVESLCELFPNADLFTLFYDPEAVSETIRSHHVTASFLNPLRRFYRSCLPLMPYALESFDLRGYDLVISSESGPAKGVIIPAGTRHICYCHTPMRYLWDSYSSYLYEWTRSPLKRAIMAVLSSHLRVWDYVSASRVDEFVANSANVQRRIGKTYRRPSQVVYPPVAVQSCYWKPAEDYYFIVSELVAYKRIDMAVRVCSKLGRKLRVVGQGPELQSLKRMAGPTVEFCGRVPDDQLREMYARCRAFLMPGEEDFGITPVEALASGKPVIALGRGGVLETVPVDKPTGGVLYQEATDGALAQAILRFESIESTIRPAELQEWATQFSREEFQRKMRGLICQSRTQAVAAD